MQLNALFPLTLSLSLREREQAGNTWLRSRIWELAPTPPTILPLPEGEGWGEGELSPN